MLKSIFTYEYYVPFCQVKQGSIVFCYENFFVGRKASTQVVVEFLSFFIKKLDNFEQIAFIMPFSQLFFSSGESK